MAAPVGFRFDCSRGDIGVHAPDGSGSGNPPSGEHSKMRNGPARPASAWMAGMKILLLEDDGGIGA